MAGVVFVGIGRGNVRRKLTRIHMAELLGLTLRDFEARYRWDNLYRNETAPDSEGMTPGGLRS